MSMVKKCAAGFVIALVGLTFLRANDLPQVPQEIRELMRDRKYDHVVSAIDNAFTDQETKPRDPEYLPYLKGRAQHLGGKYREALETFAQLELDYPAGKWLRRARFGQASALLKLGDFEAAEHIYEQEVRFLLSTERKHEIASIYLEFADAYFNPPAKDRKPDYQKALNFYKQALAVGPNGERRVDVEYRVARCHQELGQFAEAAAAYQSFLKIHPQSQFDIDVRFELGKTQLAQKQNVEARRTWKDLLSSPRVAEKPERAAEAAYEIAHTYGLPAPSSAEDLELGVAAAEKFIANYPEHKLAPKAAFEIAQGYVAQNRQDEAIRTLQKLIGNPHF